MENFPKDEEKADKNAGEVSKQFVLENGVSQEISFDLFESGLKHGMIKEIYFSEKFHFHASLLPYFTSVISW